MKTAPQPVEVRRTEPDLIDRIADALPADIRSDYYRELRHCRSLPENDEMLRILRAMQFLVLLIDGAPRRVAIERQLIEKLLTEIKDHLRGTLGASEKYHAQLESRLTTLPDAIAEGISPETIADAVKENLRQQFIRSALPETAEALSATSQEMKKVCGEFSSTACRLGDAYRGAARDASRAISDMRSEISSAAYAAEKTIRELSVTFHKAYRWSAYSLSGLAALIGFVLGSMATYWVMSPPRPIAEAAAPVVQAAPQEAPNPMKKK